MYGKEILFRTSLDGKVQALNFKYKKKNLFEKKITAIFDEQISSEF